MLYKTDLIKDRIRITQVFLSHVQHNIRLLNSQIEKVATHVNDLNQQQHERSRRASDNLKRIERLYCEAQPARNRSDSWATIL